ncbi:type II secretion system F family protein [archaeon]|nr:type II secretion system F family protein [archaeon]
MKKDIKILIVSAVIFVVLIIISMFLSDLTISANLLFLGVIALTVPYTVYKFIEFKKVKAYEKEFPNFLRDMAESQRAGLTLVQALKTVEKSDYGILTSEISKINKQLSWNVPIEKVFKKFTERMSASKVIVRSLMVIGQANRSGGNIEDTMDALANNIESLRDVQAEKSSMLNQQVIMMYAIFFIFVGITIAMVKFLVPMIQTQDLGSTFGAQNFNSNPCSVCIDSTDPSCFGCTVFATVSSAFGFGDQSNPAAYYKSLFLTMIVIQGLFTGLIAGQISSDSITAGAKHSMIMLFSGFALFIVVAKLGFV